MFISASAALLCIALNVYHEARGESIPGQYAVALVTMKRAGGDREKVCAETFRNKQFSWANNGVTKVKGGWQISKKLTPKEAHQWWVANRVALVTLSGRMYDFTNGANHYHTRYVDPYWSARKRPVKRIGAHVFYRIA